MAMDHRIGESPCGSSLMISAEDDHRGQSDELQERLEHPMISAHEGRGYRVLRARSKEWPQWLRLNEQQQSLDHASSQKMYEELQQQQLLGKALRDNVHNPLVRMMLFGVINLSYNDIMLSYKDGSSICPKYVTPKIIVEMTGKSHSSAPQNRYEAGWISAKSKSKSPNAVPEFSLRESIGTTDAKGNHVTKNILMISMAGHGCSSSEGTQGNYESINENTVVILDSQAQANATGVFSFSSIAVEEENVVLTAANGAPMETFFSGSIRHERFQLDNVHYCPEVGNRIIVSGSRLDTLGYSYGFGEGKCIVTDLSTGKVVGEGRLVDGDYIMDYLRIPRGRVFVPRPQGPALVISVWKTICSGFRTFTGLMRASTQTPRRPPV